MYMPQCVAKSECVALQAKLTILLVRSQTLLLYCLSRKACAVHMQISRGGVVTQGFSTNTDVNSGPRSAVHIIPARNDNWVCSGTHQNTLQQNFYSGPEKSHENTLQISMGAKGKQLATPTPACLYNGIPTPSDSHWRTPLKTCLDTRQIMTQQCRPIEVEMTCAH